MNEVQGINGNYANNSTIIYGDVKTSEILLSEIQVRDKQIDKLISIIEKTNTEYIKLVKIINDKIKTKKR